jgi:hypothetical protein
MLIKLLSRPFSFKEQKLIQKPKLIDFFCYS